VIEPACEKGVAVFNRFGLISFEAVSLERFGLERKWRKLATLQNEVAGLIQRYQEAAQKVAELEQGRQSARDRDLDAHAQAIRAGEEAPEPAHEAALDDELVVAVRTRDALQRATEGAVADVTAYRLEHAAKLQADIEAALSTKAQELARHAQEAAALYAEFEDGKLEAKRLIPPQGAPENVGEPQNSSVLIGPMSTRTLAGPNRGDVEAVLSYLASLGQPATVVGGVEER
jgi:hypothetical protein